MRQSELRRPAAESAGLIDRSSLLLVAVAATLWATDAYFRSRLIDHLGPAQIVFAEDGLVTLCLLPALLRGWSQVWGMNRRRQLAVAAIAAGPQALATVLFTMSFSYRVFAETYVLQQTQPLIAIGLAWFLLGERRQPWFWPLAGLAVGAVYLVLFAADPGAPWSQLQHGRVEAGLLALGAAFLWAAGTVLGRYVLGGVSFPTMASLRFTAALPILLAVVALQNLHQPWLGFAQYRAADFIPGRAGGGSILAIALVPGLLSMLLYYRALASTPASLATLGELAYPVAATLIASAPPPWGFSQPLYGGQIVGTCLLITVVALLNWTRVHRPPVSALERGGGDARPSAVAG